MVGGIVKDLTNFSHVKQFFLVIALLCFHMYSCRSFINFFLIAGGLSKFSSQIIILF